MIDSVLTFIQNCHRQAPEVNPPELAVRHRLQTARIRDLTRDAHRRQTASQPRVDRHSAIDRERGYGIRGHRRQTLPKGGLLRLFVERVIIRADA